MRKNKTCIRLKIAISIVFAIIFLVLHLSLDDDLHVGDGKILQACVGNIRLETLQLLRPRRFVQLGNKCWDQILRIPVSVHIQALNPRRLLEQVKDSVDVLHTVCLFVIAHIPLE